ncbi:MAG TPA: hypothetical protein VGO11_10085 [Chthoniobacteraceae bacterium]|jgi:hypothetical protein|nr:hypothetical protein [Chthoniobacteraceae bacterium]
MAESEQHSNDPVKPKSTLVATHVNLEQAKGTAAVLPQAVSPEQPAADDGGAAPPATTFPSDNAADAPPRKGSNEGASIGGKELTQAPVKENLQVGRELSPRDPIPGKEGSPALPEGDPDLTPGKRIDPPEPPDPDGPGKPIVIPDPDQEPEHEPIDPTLDEPPLEEEAMPKERIDPMADYRGPMPAEIEAPEITPDDPTLEREAPVAERFDPMADYRDPIPPPEREAPSDPVLNDPTQTKACEETRTSSFPAPPASVPERGRDAREMER